jgi:hypothetical protein
MINFNPYAEFLRPAFLDTVVPHTSEIDIEAALTSSFEGGAVDLPSALSSIPQRSLLFFGEPGTLATPEFILLLIPSATDETVAVRVILRLSNCSEDALQFHLPKLDVRLEAFAVSPADASTESSSSGPTKDLIFSGTVNEKEDPLVIVNVYEEGEESCNHIYVTWKVDAFLSELLRGLRYS